MQKPENDEPPVSIRLPASIENLPGFLSPMLAFASAHHLDDDRKNDLELALEEALVNIFSYAYPDKPGHIDLTCRMTDGHLVILIEDEGLPFSMVSAAVPDLNADILERKIGGLGVHLIKSLMDDVRYRREGNRNVLELILSINPQAVQQ